MHFGIKLNPCVLNGVKLTLIILTFQILYAGWSTVTKLFAIYIDDLSNELALCKSGCYINEQCMNHVIYADDICLLAPSAIDLQQMLDVCFNFSIWNDIIFNPVESVCVAFQPKKSKLFCSNVTLDNNVLEYIGRTKYLGFMFNANGQDDEDMLRQMRNLYIRSNK